MTNDDFDNELRALALAHTPKPLAHAGDLVTTVWGGWKREHEVMIDRVDVAIVQLCLTVDDRDAGNKGWMGVEHRYTALRLNRLGIPRERYGIVLDSFRTESGAMWHREHDDFNHVGLQFTIEKISPEVRETYGT